MIADIIKFFSLFFCCLYISLKPSNYSFNKNTNYVIHVFFCLFLAFLTTVINGKIPEFTYIIPLLALWIYLSLLSEQPKIMFVSMLISFSMSFCIYALSSFIMLFALYPIYNNVFSFPYTLLALTTMIFHTISTIYLFRIKRFKRGMSFLQSKKFVNIGNIVCLILLSLSMYIELHNTNSYTQLLGVFSFIISFTFLIHWWQAQITKSYKNKLMLRELESLRIELAEKEKALSELRLQNEEFGRLIHHDNKRIPAMEHAVCEYLVSDFDDINATKERAATLRLEIESLSRNRANTLSEINAKKTTHYSTGITSLDTLLNYMDKRVQMNDTVFSVHNTLELNQFVPKHIKTEDFTHLLSDLLENALIATTSCKNPSIQLQFYLFEKHFVIEIADSGIPFEAKSIVNFGLSRLTTHEDTGGSGIGLMDIWKIKETYGATLHIEEYESPSPFTKKISLIFNHKNLYSIRTHRAEEITALSKRSDLKIYSHKD